MFAKLTREEVTGLPHPSTDASFCREIINRREPAESRGAGHASAAGRGLCGAPPTRRGKSLEPRPLGGGESRCRAHQEAGPAARGKRRARRRELAAQRPERIPAGTAFPARPLASPRFPGRAWVRGEEPGEGGERPSSRASREDPGELRRSAPGGLLSTRSQSGPVPAFPAAPSSPASVGLPSSPSAAAPALPHPR